MEQSSISYFYPDLIVPYKILGNVSRKYKDQRKHNESVATGILVYEKAREVLSGFLVSNYVYNDISNNKYLLPWLSLYVSTLETLAISCFYIDNQKFKKLGEMAANKVIFFTSNSSIRQNIHRNMKYYCRKIDILSRYKLEIPGHKIFNPSIIRVSNKTKNCYFIVVREQFPINNVYANKNYGFLTDENFSFSEAIELTDTKRKTVKSPFSGVEDLRITAYQNMGKINSIGDIKGFYCCCTTPDSSETKVPYGNYPCPEMNIIKYGKTMKHPNPGKIIKWKTTPENFYTLKCWDSHKPQKNWLSYIMDDKIKVLYSANPTITMSTGIDINKSAPGGYNIKNCTIEKSRKYVWSGDFLKNSAGPITLIKPKRCPEEYKWLLKTGNMLFVVHEKYKNRERYFYYHRFLIVNSEFEILAISPCFVFDKAEIEIEYCSSISVDNKGENYLLGQGFADCAAYINKIDSIVPLEWLHRGKKMNKL